MKLNDISFLAQNEIKTGRHEESFLPVLNTVAKYLLRRYKARLLTLPCTRETSNLVGCIDYLLEAEREVESHAE